jgi:methionine-gamma-lyase
MMDEKTFRKDIKGHPLHPETLMMGYGYDPHLSEGAIKCPIFQTSTFVFRSAEEGKELFEIVHGLHDKVKKEDIGLIYSRINNPDVEILEDRLTLWDGAEMGAVFASGMAAISTVLFEFLKPGDVILHSDPLYGGTEHLVEHILPRFGIRSVAFPARNGGADAEKILRDSGLQDNLAMICIETPANPTNDLVDIGLCAEIARKYSTPQKKIVLAVDNTFLGPVFQHPLKHGADLVIYSGTKYIGGHSDLIAGMCLGSKDLVKRVKKMRSSCGGMADAWTCWLILRSLETLKMRMATHCDNAVQVANFLARHPKVEKVYYPGLIPEKSEQWQIYKKQCLAPGAMISFDIAGGEKVAFRFLNSLKLIHLAVSLGGTESLIEHPAAMTHSDMTPAELNAMGISDKMIRLSVGVEHPDDLIADLKQAFEVV